MAEKLTIEINGDVKKYKKSLKDAEKETSKFSGSISKLAAPTAIAVAGIGAAIAGAVNEAGKIEGITTQFEVLTGSAKEAANIVKDLQEFSANTPFQFAGIAKTAQQLIGFGFEAEDVKDKLQQIGDVASAVGKPIDEIGLIFGQVSAAGKLTGERLLQFQERAVPIGPAIAKTMGVAETAVKDLVSQGKVSFEIFEKSFASLSQEGGIAFEGMIKQSKTFGGLLSTVSDNISLFAADVGKELLPAAKAIATEFLNVLKNIRETDNFIVRSAKFWGKIIKDSFTTDSKEAARSLSEINKELEKVDQNIATLESQIEAGKDSSFYNSFLGGAKDDMQEYGNSLARRTELLKEQAEAEQLLADTKREEELEKDQEHEENKHAIKDASKERDLEREAEIEKIKKDKLKNLFDAKRKLEVEDLKASVKENNQRLKDEVKHGKALAQAKAFFRSQEFKGSMMLLDNLATLGAAGSKRLGRIAQVASMARATMNIAQGVTKALADFGPILGPALAASTIAAGAVQLQVISQQKFRKGGMFTGGIPGMDSIPAVVQQGEIIAPTKNFEEVIGSVRAKREAENLGGGAVGANQTVEVLVSYDSPEASQIVTISQVEDTALGISQDSFKESV